jgi:hypothetical protein
MNMHSQNYLYLGKRLGMMMKSRSVGLYRTLKYWFGGYSFEELVSDKSFYRNLQFPLISCYKFLFTLIVNDYLN